MLFKLWIVIAFSPAKAIFKDSYSGEYVAITIKHERNVPK